MAIPNKINIGQAPDDGTGDKIRDAFNKSNLNDEYLNQRLDDLDLGLVAKDFDTLSEASSYYDNYTPQSELENVKFSVSQDSTESNNGIWKWKSGETNNVEFVKEEIKKATEITSTEQDVVSGSLLYNSFQRERTGNQLFNKNDYRADIYLQSGGVLANETGAVTTKDIYIDEGETQLSWDGKPTSSGRVAWYNSSGDNILVNFVEAANATIPIPEGARNGGFFRMTILRSGDSLSSLDSFMLNFGAQIPYEDYQDGKIVSFLGVPFNTGVQQPKVAGLEWKYNNTDAPITSTELFQQFTVVPDTDGDGDTVGSTGLSYNTKTKEYVVSYYSYEKASQLWLYKRSDLTPYSPTGTIEPKPTRIIDVSSHLLHIQGNVYDPETNSYWVLGTDPDYATNGGGTNVNRLLIRVDDEGNLIEKYLLSMYDFQPGMLALSPDLKNLLIKPNGDVNLIEIDKKTKTEIRQIAVFTGTEGLGVDYENAIVWIGSGSTMRSYNYADFSTIRSVTYETLPDENSQQNMEGIVIDPIDGAIILCADGYLHGSSPNGNCIWIFDFDKTIEKSIKFPEMYDFNTGEGSINDAGEWISPVIDFGSYTDFLTNDIQIISENANVAIEYRGGNTAPNSVEINRQNWRDLPYYKDWGSITPSAWSSSKSNARYVQFKLIIS